LNTHSVSSIAKAENIEEIEVPLSLFRDRSLSVLEVLSEYLKDKLNYSYHEIATMLNRDDRTIWTAYKKSVKKQAEAFNLERTIMEMPILKLEKIFIIVPVSIFENNKLTLLEAIVVYLRNYGLRYNEIAKLLNRDQRNIWLIYSRAIKK